MSVLIVGGHDCMKCIYKDKCKEYGLKAKVFTQMPAKFQKTIGSPDCIVIMTSTVSHKMVNIARKEAKKKQIPIYHCHSSSLAALDTMLEEIKN